MQLPFSVLQSAPHLNPFLNHAAHGHKMAASLTRIPVVRNPAYRPHGQKSYVYALNKYGITPTQPTPFSRNNAQSKLMVERANGTHGFVAADDQQNDSFYTCPVQIGTPAQTVDLDLDSGSADLWVWSKKLDKRTQAAGEAQHIKIFDHTKSETFQNAHGYSWKITYGDGSGASGTVGIDTVKIGDIVVENQAVELANKVSSSFQNQSSSGLFGLAFGNINTVEPRSVKTPVENMIAQKDIPDDAALWSVYLGSVKDVEDPDQGKSFFTFGNYDESIVKASGQEIAWTPIDSAEGFWMFPSESATINGKTLNLSGNRAMADTGTTLMLVSDQFCKALYSNIDGAKYDRQQGGWLIPADGVAERPEVTVAVGDKHITIEKEQLGWSDLNDDSGMVYGAIQSRGSNPFDILGDTFLICCYAIFDVGKKRFGVVQRPDPTPAGK